MSENIFNNSDKEKIIYEEQTTKKSTENEKLLRENLEDLYKDMPITDETSCGFWNFTGPTLQKYENLNVLNINKCSMNHKYVGALYYD